MPKCTLTKLPAELILEILKAVDDFSTLFAAALTAHTLNNVWRNNVTIISKPIFSRTISCFRDAEELAIVQGHVERQHLSTKFDAKPDAEQQRAALRHCQRIRYNANLASRACDYFLQHLIDAGLEQIAKKVFRRPAYLSIHERERFYHAFYRVLTYICLGDLAPDGQERQSALLNTTLSELWRFHEIALWLLDDYAEKMRVKRGAGAGLTRPRESFDCYPFKATDLTYDARLNEVMNAWTDKMKKLGFRRPTEPTFGVDRIYYAIFDDYQERLQELNPSDDEARELAASLHRRGFF